MPANYFDSPFTVKMSVLMHIVWSPHSRSVKFQTCPFWDFGTLALSWAYYIIPLLKQEGLPHLPRAEKDHDEGRWRDTEILWDRAL